MRGMYLVVGYLDLAGQAVDVDDTCVHAPRAWEKSLRKAVRKKMDATLVVYSPAQSVEMLEWVGAPWKFSFSNGAFPRASGAESSLKKDATGSVMAALTLWGIGVKRGRSLVE